ncbi:hypothetical protein PENTCL1PPCAC_14454, partial [Pristionchus entomophagus]
MTYSVTYPIIFTSLQPILFGVMEQDRTEKELLADSTLYEPGRDGKLYNVKQFLLNLVDAVWQAAVCYATVHYLVIDSTHSAQYLGFCLASTMFTTNMTHLILETRCLNIVMIVIHFIGLLLSFGYFLGMDLLPGDELLVSEDAMSDFAVYAAMVFATIVAIVPRLMIRVSLHSNIFANAETSHQD